MKLLMLIYSAAMVILSTLFLVNDLPAHAIWTLLLVVCTLLFHIYCKLK